MALSSYARLTPSKSLEGLGSGRRIIRNELRSPPKPARIGIKQCHLKREGTRVGVDPDDLGLHVRRLADQLLLQLRVAHQLRIVLQERWRPAAAPWC